MHLDSVERRVCGDGKGFSMVLNFMPMQGQNIVMRVNEPKDDE